MTDTQHTPGDWEAAKAYPVDKNLYCAMVHAPVKTGKAHTPRVAEALGLTPEEAKANATLIATAPELLKALEALLDAPECERLKCVSAEFVRAHDAADDAIRKAKGEDVNCFWQCSCGHRNKTQFDRCECGRKAV